MQPRARTACASGARSTGKPSIATRPPTRNSQARGGLMKKPLADRPDFVSQMENANETSDSATRTAGIARRRPRATSVSAHSDDRKHQIELLLDRQRPGVQKRLLDRIMIEIARLKPEEEVRGEGHDRGDGTEEFRALGGQQILERWKHRQRDHRIERRQQPAYPALVKPRKGECAALQLRLNDPGDQVAGDDKEDVDADEAAIDRRLEVERHHREHGNRAQPVDVFAVPRLS